MIGLKKTFAVWPDFIYYPALANINDGIQVIRKIWNFRRAQKKTGN